MNLFKIAQLQLIIFFKTISFSIVILIFYIRRFYVTQPKQRTLVKIQEPENLPLDPILGKTSTQEIAHITLIYNYKNIIQNNGMGIQKTKELESVRLRRREREQKEHNSSQIEANQVKVQRKKYLQTHKNYLCKLVVEDDNQFKLMSVDLSNRENNYLKVLNPLEFNNKRPSPSVVQERTTGRFYIYDNSCGKVHIFSSDLLMSEAKDKPLISLCLNEDPPRQDPLLYLVECDHEYEWKCILFVIGGHQKYKDIRFRPFRSIKVFEIKKREVSLSPVITIMMQYPRNHPVVFVLNKEKGLHWKDSVLTKSQSTKKIQQMDPLDMRILYILGGNQMQDFANDDNGELVESVKNANKTCEYIELKKILDHINRAQEMIVEEDVNNITSMNFSRLILNDTLNIKFQNEYNPEKILNYLHHAAKFQDEVFDQNQCILIAGGGRVETLQLQAVSTQLNEINFTSGKLYLNKPTLFHSQNMIKYIKPHIHFLSDGKETDSFVLVDVYTRPNHTKASCSCLIM